MGQGKPYSCGLNIYHREGNMGQGKPCSPGHNIYHRGGRGSHSLVGLTFTTGRVTRGRRSHTLMG